jgi:chemotaxis protein methyltransferase CheR
VGGAKSLRAWSAACSTGEEAYSIAACLLAAAPKSSGVQLEVLGTDLSDESVRRAKLGEYGAWSIRETAPIPVPFFLRLGEGRIRVDESVRAITTFATHDLLDPAPAEFGDFNVIFCRNVLVYFDADTILRVTRHLAARLLPGGVIVFGVLEVSDTPPGLLSIGGPGLAAFERPLHGVPRSPTRRPRPRALSRPPGPKPSEKRTQKPEPRAPAPPRRSSTLAPAARPLPSDVKARHLDALHLIEQDQKRDALSLLSQIQRQAPDYVAALLDQALLCQKSGHKKLASELMHRILHLTEVFPVETILPGLEELPVSYYRTAAETFLKSGRRDG